MTNKKKFYQWAVEAGVDKKYRYYDGGFCKTEDTIGEDLKRAFRGNDDYIKHLENNVATLEEEIKDLKRLLRRAEVVADGLIKRYVAIPDDLRKLGESEWSSADLALGEVELPRWVKRELIKKGLF